MKIQMKTKYCLNCHVKFMIYPYRSLTAKYCSKECANKARIGKYVGNKSSGWKGGQKTKICLQCQKQFKVDIYRDKTANFCSQRCGVIYNHILFKNTRWSKLNQSCKRCLNNNNPHEANGFCKKCYSSVCKLLKRYNMTIEVYDALIKKQNGKCLICKQTPRPDSMGRQFSVDHDHKTGKVRGILCAHCNSLLGHAFDNPEILKSAIKYLSQ